MNVSVNPPVPFATEVGNIRMESEHISIYFGDYSSRVEVEFTFRNLGDEREYALAGFPDENLLWQYIYRDVDPDIDDVDLVEYYSHIWGDGVIHDFKAWTRPEGYPEEENVPLDYEVFRSVRDSIDLEEFPNGEWESHGTEAIYRAFQLDLDPGEAVVVGNSYSTPNGSYAGVGNFLFYTLKTGHNWRGTIGEALVDVYVMDGQDPDDLSFDGLVIPTPGKEHWTLIDDTHFQLRITDFEPVGIYSGLFVQSRSMARWIAEQEAQQEDQEAKEEK